MGTAIKNKKKEKQFFFSLIEKNIIKIKVEE